MSYNISTWKTKRLENLVVPLKAFELSERTDWHPQEVKIRDVATMAATIPCGCEQEIRGKLVNGEGGMAIAIEGFEMAGEGSGTFYNEVLEPALAASTGHLEAVLIWERGDSITRLVVADGVVTNEAVEL